MSARLERAAREIKRSAPPPRLLTTPTLTPSQAHFPTVLEVDVPDDVNRVLLAYTSAGAAALLPKGDAAAARALVAGLGGLGGGAAASVDPGACVDGPTLVDLALEMRER